MLALVPPGVPLTRAPRMVVAGVAGLDVLLTAPLEEALPAGTRVVALTRDIAIEVACYSARCRKSSWCTGCRRPPGGGASPGRQGSAQ